MLTPEQQETLKARLDALDVQPEKPRNWKPYIQIESDFYDVAEVLAAVLGAIEQAIPEQATGINGFDEMMDELVIHDERAQTIYDYLATIGVGAINDLTTEQIDKMAELDGVGPRTVERIHRYRMGERQAQA